jgi:surfactin synthase thioesterase subunit
VKVPHLWLNMRPGVREPSCLVVLVPHAGAGPTNLRPLEQLLPDDWGVFALALPGRELRLAEPPDWDLADVARQAAQAMSVLMEAVPESVPLLVAGQCSGAWLAHAILARGGRRLQERCRALLVVAQSPWDAPRSPNVLPEDSDALWAHLLASGNTPPDVAADEEIREMLEPAIRADYRAVARFPADAEPLGCPIVAIAGDRDPTLESMRLPGWARYTRCLRTVGVPSGHLPMQQASEEIARIMVSTAQ